MDKNIVLVFTCAALIKIVVLHIEGCASIVGFRNVGKTVKYVDDESVDIVVRRMKAEALALPRSNDYDLSHSHLRRLLPTHVLHFCH